MDIKPTSLTFAGIDAVIPAVLKFWVPRITTFVKPGATTNTATDFSFLARAALRACGAGTGIHRWNGRRRIGSYNWGRTSVKHVEVAINVQKY